jgi:hypothetical protein
MASTAAIGARVRRFHLAFGSQECFHVSLNTEPPAVRIEG